MEVSIFSQKTYKSFLRQAIRSAPKSGHGYRTLLAKAMQIQPTYLSQVLKGTRDLSLDQGVLLAGFLHLSKEETEFLILLINWERAGSSQSKAFFEKLIGERRNTYLRVKDRVKISHELDDTAKGTYYSDIAYGSAHIGVTIPSLRTIPALSQRLQISPQRTKEIIEFLAIHGLVQQKAEHLLPGENHLFVDKTSPFVVSHHRNWRLKAMERAALRAEDDYQVSLGITLSEKDAVSIRQRLAQMTEEISKQVKDSKEERLMGLCIDFFDY